MSESKTQNKYKKGNALSVYSDNCLNQRSPLAGCTICETICPQHALSYLDGKWEATNCTLCGICAMVCPTQVFQIDMPYLLHLSPQPLSLCCSQNGTAPSEAMRINCFQQLTPLSILHLLYRHSSVTIYLPLEHCKQCTHQWYAQGLIQQLHAYRIPQDKLNIIVKEQPTSSEENVRRDMFRNFLHRTEQNSKKILVQTVEKISAEFTSKEITQKEPAVFPTRLPLYALYHKKQLPLFEQQELPFRKLSCSTCNFCGACVYICPTEALTIQRTETEKQLSFHAELCINCNLCQQICMQHGLQWGDFITAKEFVQSPEQLAYSSEQICSRCGHEFYQWPPTNPDIAPVCSFCK